MRAASHAHPARPSRISRAPVGGRGMHAYRVTGAQSHDAARGIMLALRGAGLDPTRQGGVITMSLRTDADVASARAVLCARGYAIVPVNGESTRSTRVPDGYLTSAGYASSGGYVPDGGRPMGDSRPGTAVRPMHTGGGTAPSLPSHPGDPGADQSPRIIVHRHVTIDGRDIGAGADALASADAPRERTIRLADGSTVRAVLPCYVPGEDKARQEARGARIPIRSTASWFSLARHSDAVPAGRTSVVTTASTSRESRKTLGTSAR